VSEVYAVGCDRKEFGSGHEHAGVSAVFLKNMLDEAKKKDVRR